MALDFGLGSQCCLFRINLIILILAAPAHSRCTSLVCSCYVASRNSDSREEESRRVRSIDDGSRKRVTAGSGNHRDGGMVFMEEISSHESRGVDRSKNMQAESAAPLKSNLKRTASTTTMMEMMNGKLSTGMRKVSWSDAHGKDIAHVQEFEPSEEGELGGVGNSCRCAIQ
ncbi:hypothetical protein Salat_1727100 [Sesamum alatum]|uniref:Uncharacterized protein n=1 Tax=Sesamum alatum TaxID=300844 RepID=A0AAE2CKB9_9LAMI|nr:hypothetical protein Salat_1727100 [Sesamum alatum]